ncbi:MAG: type VI secretion protein IcmF/TssM N-terminal domain-containing protein [Geobacteraceae bacterium]|nr:type VI secretion protein IcmF/TssM N-terminal domain-containing protein [Geobacteraceae bacterium]
MKDGIKRVFRVCLVLTACVLVALLVFGAVLVLDWPLWVGFFLLLLLAGLWLGCRFLRKLLKKRREENFVSDMAEQDMARMRAVSAREKNEIKELHDRWKEAVERLRASHLKKFGNPLYVLPWYMVIGESGSGKTTSLNSARIATPFADFGRVRGISGTRQCDWYFFEQAIVIDTAGRYTKPVNGEQDKDEWQKFLSLLLRYRRREPLNGLIVTVAADHLLTALPEELEKDGRAIRRRVDELMRALGVRFPVYTLVTKCDLVNGINRFCECLPEKSLSQPMGFINQDISPDAAAFLDRALNTTDERLRNLRLQLLHELREKRADPALLLFPEEFERLKHGLGVFMGNVFSENPYQETPVLRGVFFSSGRQEGSPHSRFSECAATAGIGEALPGTDKGLFLHDFFSSILPGDRYLLAPTRRSIEWRSLTGNLGLTSWVIVGVAICGLLSFSFVKNMKTIRDISQEVSGPSTLKGETLSNLVALERFRREIAGVEEQNRNWWIPRFGLKESIRVERELKARYCRQFRGFLLAPFDQQLAGSMANLSPATPDEVYGQFVVHVVRRINILKARAEGAGMEGLLAKPQPSYVTFLNNPDPGEAKKTFGPLYLSYLLWRTDAGDAVRETADLQSWLKQMIAAKNGNLQWISAWVDSQSGLTSVSLKDFWGGSLAAQGEKWVQPSFTRKGKKAVDSLLQELRSALPDPGLITSKKAAFATWYREAAFGSWQGFAAGFSKGIERLRGAGEWRSVAAVMADDKGPYFSLLNRIAIELEPLAKEGALPPWLQQVYSYQAERLQGVARVPARLRSVGGGNRVIRAVRRTIGRDAEASPVKSPLVAGKSCQAYRKALAAIAPAAASRSLAFQLASQTFAQDRMTGTSHFYTAATALSNMKNDMGAAGSDELFWQLQRGPLEFLWAFVRKESGCQLQSMWEEQVLAPTLGMTPQQALPVLVGPDGLAWRFMKGPAAPFLAGSRNGYRTKEAMGGTVPLQPALFAFFGKGAQAQAAVAAMGRPQNFNVGIRGLPTDANSEAALKPHATRLELQCGGNSQTLVNSNYPVSRTFSWSPDTCGDVDLQIEIGDVVLNRHYMGQDGFPKFLRDMHGGRRTFAAREFPGESVALQRMGVKSITVNYRFIGSGAILKQTTTLSGQAPRSIAQCWAQ